MENWTHTQLMDITFLVLRLASLAFLAILFLQSGMDKVLDWKGNLAWLKGHFAKSPLGKQVPVLLATLTVMEVGTGFATATGFVQILVKRPALSEFGFLGCVMALISLLMLFFGQRMAKDYNGAAGIVPYFVVALLSLLLHGYAGTL